MKTPILPFVPAGLVLVALAAHFWLTRPRPKHEPVEYYRGWGRYSHPVALKQRITKQEADALIASGAVCLIGEFDGDGRLTRVAKLYRGEMFFEYLYRYHPNGRLESARVTRDGRVTVLEYDARGRRLSDSSIAF